MEANLSIEVTEDLLGMLALAFAHIRNLAKRPAEPGYVAREATEALKYEAQVQAAAQRLTSYPYKRTPRKKPPRYQQAGMEL